MPSKIWFVRNIPEALRRAVRIQAAKENRTVGAIVEDALRQYLEAAAK